MPFITENAAQPDPFCPFHFPRQLHQCFQATGPAAPLSDVQIHQHIDHRSILPGRRADIADILRIVDDHQHPRLPGQVHGPTHRQRVDDFVGDHHFRNPRIDHDFGFADSRAAQPDRAGAHLFVANGRSLVRLRMGTNVGFYPGQIIGHRRQIPVQLFDVNHQRRRGNLLHGHTDPTLCVHGFHLQKIRGARPQTAKKTRRWNFHRQRATLLSRTGSDCIFR